MTSPPLVAPRLLLELGRGGMGTVYLAEGADGLCVFKALSPELAGDAVAARLFEEEARLSASLVHPNIVRAFGARMLGGHPALEMEFLDGRPLDAVQRARMRERRRLPAALALWVVDQVLAALDYLHELRDAAGRPLGLVHRDVSPHNVFLTYAGDVKLLDFGIAKAHAGPSFTRTGEIKGKPIYMAPEQSVPRGPVDRRADVFAAGVVLWELLTGERYFPVRTDGDELDAASRDSGPRSLCSVDPALPARLDAAVAVALAREPAARYASAAELRAALHEFRGGGADEGPRALRAELEATFASTRAALHAAIDARRASPGASLVPPPSPPESGTPDAWLPSTPPGWGGRGSADAQASVRKPEPMATRRFAVGVVGAIAAAALGTFAFRARRDHALDRRGDAASMAVGIACATSATCPAEHVCRSARCVPLATSECRVLAAPSAVHDPRTVWFGTMFRLAKEGDFTGNINEEGVRLAVDDFRKVAGGVPSLASGAPPRPLGLVACDDTVAPERAARHLAEELRVPAIIGFGTSQELLDLAPRVLVPTGTLSMATANGSSAISRIPTPGGDARLVWRTSMAGGGTAKALARLVSQVAEPSLRKALALRPAEPMRVALVREDSAAGLSTADVFESELVFNGRAALENGEHFLEMVIPADGRVDTALVDRLLAFAPHVVLVSLSTEATFGDLFPPLEARWNRAHAYRPLYLEDQTLLGDAHADLVVRYPDARRRLFGVYGPLNTSQNQRFTLRFNESRKDKLPYTEVPGPCYDALYVLAYAASLQGQAEIDGAALARAIGRLMGSGPRADVGPDGIAAAVEQLRLHGQIDLRGTGSNLDFDPRTGDVAGDMVLDCERTLPRSAQVASEEIDVLYDGRAQTWRGVLTCP